MSQRTATLRVGAIILILASQVIWPLAASAHSGGLNAEGCHNDRKNGGYHCHRSPVARPAPRSDAHMLQANRPRPGQGGQDAGGHTYYANCSAARAAGAAPVRIGEPGYARHLDRDGDGVGCE